MSVWREEVNGHLYVLDKKGATQRGKPYRLRIRRNGQHVEAPSFDDEASARTYADKHQHRQRGQLAPGATRTPATGAATLRDYWNVWWPRQKHRAPATEKLRRNHWNGVVLDRIGDRPLAALDYDALDDFLAGWYETHAVNTVNSGWRGTLQLLMKDAARPGGPLHATGNPAVHITLRSPINMTDRAPDHALTREEALLIITEMRPRYQIMGVLAMETGMRLRELTGLQNAEIRYFADRAVIHVNWQLDEDSMTPGGAPAFMRPKNGNIRQVVIAPWLATQIKAHQHTYPNRHGLLLTNSANNTLVNQQPQKEWQRILRELGYSRQTHGPQWTGWHQLRHHCASSLLHTPGVSHSAIAKQLGHTIQTLSNTYSHWMKDDAAEEQLLRAMAAHDPQHPHTTR